MAGISSSPANGETDVVCLGQLVRERRLAKGLSQEALAAKAFSNSTRKGYVSAIENGKIPNITRETVRSIARALEIDSEAIPPALRWLEATEEVKHTNTIVQEIQSEIENMLVAAEARAQQDQFAELIAELKRQNNLPYEVQRDRAAAKAALLEKDLNKARVHLEAAAEATRETAGHALLEYARSLAALGALAFTAVDFKEARRQYGEAIRLPELSEDRVNRYRRSYRIASNAIVSRSENYAEGRKVLNEMVASGVTPDEVTYNTLLNLSPNFGERQKVLNEMVASGVTPDEVTYNTLLKKAQDSEHARSVIDLMAKADPPVPPNKVTFSTVGWKAKAFADARLVIDIVALANRTGRPNVNSLNGLLNCNLTFEEARSVIELMALADPPAPVRASTFNTLLTKAKTFEEASSVIELMAAADPPVPQKAKMLNSLIKAARTFEEVCWVVELMADTDPPAQPSIVTYSRLINTAQSLDEANSVIDLIAKSNTTSIDRTAVHMVRAVQTEKTASASNDSLTNYFDGNSLRGFLNRLSLNCDAEEILGWFIETCQILQVPLPPSALEITIQVFYKRKRINEALRVAVVFPHLPASRRLMLDHPTMARVFFEGWLERERNHATYALACLASEWREPEMIQKWATEASNCPDQLPDRTPYLVQMLRSLDS